MSGVKCRQQCEFGANIFLYYQSASYVGALVPSGINRIYDPRIRYAELPASIFKRIVVFQRR
jgi:hypothetical protein